MFNKKSKQINQLKKEKSEQIDDFILILKQIQELSNSTIHWKQKKITINNAIELAIENYINKKVELE